MQFDLDNLPSEPTLLQHLIRDMAAVVEHRDGEIERLKSIIKKLQRAQFGRRSERLDPDQPALALEEIGSDLAREEEKRPHCEKPTAERPSRRKPLPDHLQREDVRLDIESMICSCCGGALHVIGESVSEMLDWVPAQLRVIRTTRPKYACRSCETVVQAPAPERPIAGGLATPALLAQVLVSKYCDHTPLYRQSQIFARHGVDLPRSTLAGWVGGACWWLEALHERLARNVFASDHLFADDTPVPVLDPGRGRTKTGRLWVYAREQRAWGGPEPRTMLKMVYAGKYNEYVDEIEGSAHLRSWPEQVLLALVFKTLTDKLAALLDLRLAGTALAGEVSVVTADLRRLRDRIAGQVGTDRTDFTNRAIATWSRMISLFRTGLPPAKADAYEVISTAPVGQLAGDMNVRAAGFGELGVALALLEHGREGGLWTLSPPADAALTSGAMASLGSWPGAASRPIFLARSASVALDLEKRGAFADDNAIVIHADDVWHRMRSTGTDSSRTRSRAPGRTGRIGTRHVSIAAMLGAEAAIVGLRTRFINEVTL